MALTVLVSGATGRLGGPVASLLLERGHRVRALTRAPGSAPATELQRLGAEVTHGDLDEPATLLAGARGADAAFITTTPHGASPEAEARRAKNLADAAVAAGVE